MDFPTDRAAVLAAVDALLVRVGARRGFRSAWGDYHRLHALLRHYVSAKCNGQASPAEADAIVSATLDVLIPPLHLRLRPQEPLSAQIVLSLLADRVLDHLTGSTSEDGAHPVYVSGAARSDHEVLAIAFGVAVTPARYRAVLGQLRGMGLRLDYQILTQYLDLVARTGAPVPMAQVAAALRAAGIDVTADEAAMTTARVGVLLHEAGLVDGRRH